MNRRDFLVTLAAGFAVAAMPKAVAQALGNVKPRSIGITTLVSNPLFTGQIGIWNGINIITSTNRIAQVSWQESGFAGKHSVSAPMLRQGKHTPHTLPQNENFMWVIPSSGLYPLINRKQNNDIDKKQSRPFLLFK